MRTSVNPTYKSARATITNAANLHGSDIWERCIAVNTALDAACKQFAGEIAKGSLTKADYGKIKARLSRLASKFTV